MSASPQERQVVKASDSVSEEQSMGELDDEHSEAYKAMERRITWKFDLHIVPIVILLWLANFIDRANVGNARIAGLEKDLKLKGNQFNTALCAFYVSYILVELPSNWIIKRVKASRWLPISMVGWGIVTTLTSLIQNFSGLTAGRFFLGFFEGGITPGLSIYMTTIYSPYEFQSRMAIFYASCSIAGAFGGLLASAIIKMNGVGNLAGWRWMFILEGLATILLGVVSFAILPADIATAKFLTAEEREFALRRQRRINAVSSRVPASYVPDDIDEKGDHEKITISHLEGSTTDADSLKSVYMEEKFEWREIRRGLLEPQVWISGIGYFGLIVALYSYSLFLPTIIAGLGYKGESAQLHTVPPYVPASVLTVIIAVLADRMKIRGPFVLLCMPLAIAGYALAIRATTVHERYAAVFLVGMGIYPSGPCLLTLVSYNTSGHYKRATAIALMCMLSNCGSFVAMFSYTSDQLPGYVRGHTITLAFITLTWVMAAANLFYCKWENKARAEGRRNSNIQKYQELWESGKTRAPIGDRHPDFRFAL